jgi:hypothetical protein
MTRRSLVFGDINVLLMEMACYQFQIYLLCLLHYKSLILVVYWRILYLQGSPMQLTDKASSVYVPGIFCGYDRKCHFWRPDGAGYLKSCKLTSRLEVLIVGQKSSWSRLQSCMIKVIAVMIACFLF